jgi:hypothetical protein
MQPDIANLMNFVKFSILHGIHVWQQEILFYLRVKQKLQNLNLKFLNKLLCLPKKYGVRRAKIYYVHWYDSNYDIDELFWEID